MRPEAKLQFEKACEVLNLDPERRDRAWRQISDLGLNPDDPTTIFLAVAGVLEKASEDLPASISALPGKVEEAAKRAVGPVAAAATKQVEAAYAAQSARIGPELARQAAAWFETEAGRQKIRVSGVIATGALLLAVTFGVVGYWIGSWSLAELDASVRALAGRSDIRTVLGLLTANPDLNASVGTWCGSGSSRVIVSEGMRNCSVPLWLDGSGGSVVPAEQATSSVVGMWQAGVGFLNRLHPLTILAGGLVLGVLLRKLLQGVQAVPGVKWLAS